MRFKKYQTIFRLFGIHHDFSAPGENLYHFVKRDVHLGFFIKGNISAISARDLNMLSNRSFQPSYVFLIQKGTTKASINFGNK